MHSASQAASLESISERGIAAMRLIFAAVALVVVYIDPSEPDRYVAVTYTTLALYVAYSAMLFAYAWRGIPLALTAMAYWVDVG